MDREYNTGCIGIPQGKDKMKAAHYRVRSYKRRNKHGFNSGKIRELEIKIDGKVVADFNKGWIVKPDDEDKDVQVALCILLYNYN